MGWFAIGRLFPYPGDPPKPWMPPQSWSSPYTGPYTGPPGTSPTAVIYRSIAEKLGVPDFEKDAVSGFHAQARVMQALVDRVLVQEQRIIRLETFVYRREARDHQAEVLARGFDPHPGGFVDVKLKPGT